VARVAVGVVIRAVELGIRAGRDVPGRAVARSHDVGPPTKPVLVRVARANDVGDIVVHGVVAIVVELVAELRRSWVYRFVGVVAVATPQREGGAHAFRIAITVLVCGLMDAAQLGGALVQSTRVGVVAVFHRRARWISRAGVWSSDRLAIAAARGKTEPGGNEE
jgi:hypothetical protein